MDLMGVIGPIFAFVFIVAILLVMSEVGFMLPVRETFKDTVTIVAPLLTIIAVFTGITLIVNMSRSMGIEEEIKENVHCKHCGAQIPAVSEFCPNCGKEVKE